LVSGRTIRTGTGGILCKKKNRESSQEGEVGVVGEQVVGSLENALLTASKEVRESGGGRQGRE